jgi:hypothetical protein
MAARFAGVSMVDRATLLAATLHKLGAGAWDKA